MTRVANTPLPWMGERLTLQGGDVRALLGMEKTGKK
jgi:hypothetical protein